MNFTWNKAKERKGYLLTLAKQMPKSSMATKVDKI
jgi:hypothetical protein